MKSKQLPQTLVKNVNSLTISNFSTNSQKGSGNSGGYQRGVSGSNSKKHIFESNINVDGRGKGPTMELQSPLEIPGKFNFLIINLYFYFRCNWFRYLFEATRSYNFLANCQK